MSSASGLITSGSGYDTGRIGTGILMNNAKDIPLHEGGTFVFLFYLCTVLRFAHILHLVAIREYMNLHSNFIRETINVCFIDRQ